MPKMFSNSEINKAGETIAKTIEEDKKFENAVIVINSWREQHYYPISVMQVPIRKVAYEIEDDAIVVQRLKKKDTIIDKIKRYPNMRLSSMQDIGGCRVIFKDKESVYLMLEKLLKQKTKKKYSIAKDYIKDEPKDDGYRGIHLVCTYYGRKKSIYDGLKVEIQIRTYLQHLWATAVEIVDTFMKTKYKTKLNNIILSDEEKAWAKFWKLVSSLIATIEGSPTVKDTPVLKGKIIKEINEISNEYSLMNKLKGYKKTAYKSMTEKNKHAYLLRIINGETEIEEFTKREVKNGYLKYLQYEKNNEDVVFVFGESIESIIKGYNNYFSNIENFVQFLELNLREVENEN